MNKQCVKEDVQLSTNQDVASLMSQKRQLQKRIRDLEWQIWFAKNHIFYCEEERVGRSDNLQDLRDRAVSELNRLSSV